jgi:predicted flap endonuclease-1-like 5' DNA nuclease
VSDAERAAIERRTDALQNTLDDHVQRLEAAHRELADSLGAKDEIAKEADERQVELAALHDEVRGLHTAIAPLETQLKQRDAALDERAQRIEALETQLAVFATQTETLQATLRQRGERIGALERKLTERSNEAGSAPADREPDMADQRIAEQVLKNNELTRLLEARERDVTQAAKTNDLNEKSMRVLKQQLDDARASEERLAAQVRELKAAAQRAPDSAPPATKVAMSKPAGLFEASPEQVDELQQIHGIGAGFERGLNKLGIFQFSQLAGLSAEEIAWIEANLPTFHGRIERDDWPGQAAALLAASEHAEWSLRAQLDVGAPAPRIN